MIFRPWQHYYTNSTWNAKRWKVGLMNTMGVTPGCISLTLITVVWSCWCFCLSDLHRGKKWVFRSTETGGASCDLQRHERCAPPRCVGPRSVLVLPGLTEGLHLVKGLRFHLNALNETHGACWECEWAGQTISGVVRVPARSAILGGGSRQN